MKDWLKTASIPTDRQLKADLVGPMKKPNSSGTIFLEGKKEMRSRGLASPDAADALAVTFAFPVAHREYREPARRVNSQSRQRNQLLDGIVKKSVSLAVGRGEKLPVSKGAGLTAKGRAKYNAATGSNLKAPAPSPKTAADKGAKRHFVPGCLAW
jgi:hypothetical protein